MNKRMVSCAAALGLLAGMLKTFPLFVNWTFGVPAQQMILVLELLSSELFYIVPISIAKGITARSPSQIRISCVFGVVAAVLSTGAIVAVTAYSVETNTGLSWLNPRHLSGFFIGGAVGSIFGVRHRRHNLRFIAMGVLAASLGLLFLIPISAFLRAGSLVIWKLTSSLNVAMLYERVGIPALEGLFQSVIPWTSLALLESHRYERETAACTEQNVRKSQG